MNVGVIDYGAGNVVNVLRAFEAIELDVRVVASPQSAADVSHLVLPGVGAFGFGISSLRSSGMADCLIEYFNANRPILGICLGMHLMASEGTEGGRHPGLGLLPGRAQHLMKLGELGEGVRIPNTGWAEVQWEAEQANGLGNDLTHAYFNHSYAYRPEGEDEVLASSRFGGHTFAAAVRHGSCTAVQFHPEKSGWDGLSFLRGWVRSTLN